MMTTQDVKEKTLYWWAVQLGRFIQVCQNPSNPLAMILSYRRMGIEPAGPVLRVAREYAEQPDRKNELMDELADLAARDRVSRNKLEDLC